MHPHFSTLAQTGSTGAAPVVRATLHALRLARNRLGEDRATAHLDAAARRLAELLDLEEAT